MLHCRIISHLLSCHSSLASDIRYYTVTQMSQMTKKGSWILRILLLQGCIVSDNGSLYRCSSLLITTRYIFTCVPAHSCLKRAQEEILSHIWELLTFNRGLAQDQNIKKENWAPFPNVFQRNNITNIECKCNKISTLIAKLRIIKVSFIFTGFWFMIVCD